MKRKKNNTRILICDDEPSIRKVLRDIILSAGYEAILAKNGKEAVEIFKKEMPDLILLDVSMPGMSGFEVLEIIRKDFKEKYIPVIFLTASVDIDNKVRALNGGAVDYLIKPVSADELLARIKNFLEMKEKYDTLRKEATFDWMTGILNKVYFLRKAKEELDKALCNGTSLTFILIDIDGLKKVNDTLGHLAGDKVIREFAERLKKLVRRADLIGRFGGDEFMVMLSQKAMPHARVVSDRLRESMKSPVNFNGDKINVTFSMGVVEIRQKETVNINSLLTLADEALYEAKSNGGNQYITK